VSITVNVTTAGIDLCVSSAEQKRRQNLYARRAAFLMRPYVPVRETILRSSEPVSSDYAAGILTWSTPYAARQYYEPMIHTEAGTTDHWDEAMWRNDGEDLKKFAGDLFSSY
jgi:hypothetical protein